jgi:hypothetical protein
MKSFPVKDIPPDSFFSQLVYLDSQFVLAAPEMPFSSELIKVLQEWEFNEVFSAGEPREAYAAEADETKAGGGPRPFLPATAARSKKPRIFTFPFKNTWKTSLPRWLLKTSWILNW